MSFAQSNYVLSGPTIDTIPECSLAEYLFSKLKNLPPKKVIQVDTESGSEQTAGGILQDSIRACKGMAAIGIQKNDVVVVMGKNTFEAAITILATWLLGAVVNPVNVAWKESELEHIFKITKPKFLFCEEDTVTKVISVLRSLALEAKVIILDKKSSSYLTLKQMMKKENADGYQPAKLTDPSADIALLLSSSGTTGPFKIVGIPHKSMIFQDIVTNQLHLFKNKGDLLQITSFNWVTGIITLLKSLTLGLKRINMKTTDPVAILKAIQKFKPRWVICPPILYVYILEQPDFSKYNVSSLTHIVLAGTPFTSAMLERTKGKCEHSAIYQNYGLSEVGGLVTFSEEGQSDVLSVGKLVCGVQAKVVDIKTGKNLPPKEVGEIRIKSPGIMKCYMNNEEATKEAFDKEGYLCSGDLGYYDDQGFFYLVSRIKELIKVDNTPIAPGDIENIIAALPGVMETVVSGVSKDGHTVYLVALVVKKKSHPLTEEEIKTHVDKNVTSDIKKLTGGVYFVDALPKNTNGKFQRNQIQEIAHSLYFGSDSKAK